MTSDELRNIIIYGMPFPDNFGEMLVEQVEISMATHNEWEAFGLTCLVESEEAK